MKDLLIFDRVSKEYKGFSLQAVSFRVPSGCIMGLVGPNGAGKTTLIRIAMNLLRKSGGTITAFGLDSERDEVAVKARIGYVPDEPRFIEDATLRSIASATAAFFPGWDAGTFRQLMETFDLNPRMKFGKLSQGMKTKFSLAMAFSRGAELLLLDEPTAGLDPLFRRDLLRRLSGYLQDERRSVLFSTHITTDLERTADYVTFLHGGRLIFSLSLEEIRTRWCLVKGASALLEREESCLFSGVRRGQMGMEALSGYGDQARRAFSECALVERASLEDILVLYGTGGYPPTANHDPTSPFGGFTLPAGPVSLEKRFL